MKRKGYADNVSINVWISDYFLQYNYKKITLNINGMLRQINY